MERSSAPTGCHTHLQAPTVEPSHLNLLNFAGLRHSELSPPPCPRSPPTPRPRRLSHLRTPAYGFLAGLLITHSLGLVSILWLQSALCLPCMTLVTLYCLSPLHPCEAFGAWAWVQLILDSPGSGTGPACHSRHVKLNKSLAK